MHEKIKEFAIRCNIETGSYEYGSRKEFDYEKFAELIIRECYNVVSKTRWHIPPTQEQIALDILDQFEVER